MVLDTDSCYRAVRRRDRRYDGRFFTAVLTTGVYCRPVCPAPTPRLGNVRFFPCASAAEEAGFRPCLRCRPESAPGTPAWIGTSATVTRALRLIADGGLDRGGLDRLAARLGIGARHLRRLFGEELGASPVAVAQTRRAHFARRLIDQTALPMTEIARAAGFGSLRRFNDVMKGTFGRPPSQMRLRRPLRQDAGAIRLRIAFRVPYDWPAVAGFLSARAIPGVELVTPGSYSRTFEIDGARGVLEVRPDPDGGGLLVFVDPPSTRRLIRIVERTRRLFDCGADPMQIAADLGRDPLLARLLRRHPGLRVPGAWDGFELSVRAILGQQVTVKGAGTLAGRLVESFGRPIGACGRPGLTHLFPDPRSLARADLRVIGIPGARAEAIRSLARAVSDGVIAFDVAKGPEDPVERLAEIPGIGDWTAEYIAMRALGEPDAFPAGDLGLRRAAGGRKILTARQMERRAEAWRPWRAYAAILLWTRSASRAKEAG
jgi:AraC family transcriptional regulator of adaptative response / DNA-3-methyladenine glycosylase II